jgi:hypothetical protein
MTNQTQTQTQTNNPILTTEPHSSRSNRYSLIDTQRVIDAIQANGFKMTDFQKRRVLNPANEGYQKHMAVFEPTALVNLPPAPTGHKWQIIMNNSHDGTCSYQLFGGCFRFACENGLILGDFAATFKIRHVGFTESKVNSALKEVYSTFETQREVVERMQAFKPTASEITEVAKAIATDRIKKRKDASSYNLRLSSVIASHRAEDMETDLWTYFNRIQENIIRGGVKYSYRTTEEGKWGNLRTKQHNRTTKAIKSFSEQQALNRMVFEKCFALLGQKQVIKS